MYSTSTHFADVAQQAVKRLAFSLGLTAAFVVIEVIAGFFANSLALLTDAAHNFTDVLALALTWYALRLTMQPANHGKTYGYHRAGILVALVNSTTLALIALGIFYEAYHRLFAPLQVEADILIGVGITAVAVNLGTALLVRSGSEHDLNLHSTFLHLMGDVLSTVGAVVAGIVIRFTGLNWVDPLASFFIGLLILWNAWGILRESVNILMESTPADIDVKAMLSDICAIEGVRDVHDLHVWSITRRLRTLSAYIVTDDIPISLGAKIQVAIGGMLSQKYRVAHATLQLECAGCTDGALYCDIANSHAHNQ